MIDSGLLPQQGGLGGSTLSRWRSLCWLSFMERGSGITIAISYLDEAQSISIETWRRSRELAHFPLTTALQVLSTHVPAASTPGSRPTELKRMRNIIGTVAIEGRLGDIIES